MIENSPYFDYQVKSKQSPLDKAFWKTLLYKQNKYHHHGVFVHTLKVVYSVIKAKDYKFLAAAILHDIGKPFVAYQDEEDKITGEYSFTDHEEKSFQIIQNWPFVSNYTKKLVRFHYIIRDMKKSLEKDRILRYKRLKEMFHTLEEDFVEDIKKFQKHDDYAKGKKW